MLRYASAQDFLNAWAKQLWDICRTEEYYVALRKMTNETLQMGRQGLYAIVPEEVLSDKAGKDVEASSPETLHQGELEVYADRED